MHIYRGINVIFDAKNVGIGFQWRIINAVICSNFEEFWTDLFP